MSLRDALATLGIGSCQCRAYGDLIADLATWLTIGDGQSSLLTFIASLTV